MNNRKWDGVSFQIYSFKIVPFNSMTKTIFILVLMFGSYITSYSQQDISDSLFGARLNNFKCDTSVHSSYFTWDSSPICVNGFDEFARNFNSSLDLQTKFNGNIMVSFLINCKGEIDFVRFISIGKRKRSHSVILNDGKMNTELFEKCGTWKPATSNGANVDSEHVLMFLFNKGKVISISEFYEN